MSKSRPPAFQSSDARAQYVLLLHVDEADRPRLAKPEQEQRTAAYLAYTEALKQAGAFVATSRLQPSSTATTVRVANGRTRVLEGPYTDTKEQLGGLYVIDVPDLDAALSWAARCPTAGHGVVEVRPLATVPAAVTA